MRFIPVNLGDSYRTIRKPDHRRTLPLGPFALPVDPTETANLSYASPRGDTLDIYKGRDDLELHLA